MTSSKRKEGGPLQHETQPSLDDRASQAYSLLYELRKEVADPETSVRINRLMGNLDAASLAHEDTDEQEDTPEARAFAAAIEEAEKAIQELSKKQEDVVSPKEEASTQEISRSRPHEAAYQRLQELLHELKEAGIAVPKKDNLERDIDKAKKNAKLSTLNKKKKRGAAEKANTDFINEVIGRLERLLPKNAPAAKEEAPQESKQRTKTYSATDTELKQVYDAFDAVGIYDAREQEMAQSAAMVRDVLAKTDTVSRNRALDAAAAIAKAHGPKKVTPDAILQYIEEQRGPEAQNKTLIVQGPDLESPEYQRAHAAILEAGLGDFVGDTPEAVNAVVDAVHKDVPLNEAVAIFADITNDPHENTFPTANRIAKEYKKKKSKPGVFKKFFPRIAKAMSIFALTFGLKGDRNPDIQGSAGTPDSSRAQATQVTEAPKTVYQDAGVTISTQAPDASSSEIDRDDAERLHRVLRDNESQEIAALQKERDEERSRKVSERLDSKWMQELQDKDAAPAVPVEATPQTEAPAPEQPVAAPAREVRKDTGIAGSYEIKKGQGVLHAFSALLTDANKERVMQALMAQTGEADGKALFNNWKETQLENNGVNAQTLQYKRGVRIKPGDRYALAFTAEGPVFSLEDKIQSEERELTEVQRTHIVQKGETPIGVIDAFLKDTEVRQAVIDWERTHNHATDTDADIAKAWRNKQLKKNGFGLTKQAKDNPSFTAGMHVELRTDKEGKLGVFVRIKEAPPNTEAPAQQETKSETIQFAGAEYTLGEKVLYKTKKGDWKQYTVTDGAVPGSLQLWSTAKKKNGERSARKFAISEAQKENLRKGELYGDLMIETLGAGAYTLHIGESDHYSPEQALATLMVKEEYNGDDTKYEQAFEKASQIIGSATDVVDTDDPFTVHSEVGRNISSLTINRNGADGWQVESLTQ